MNTIFYQIVNSFAYINACKYAFICSCVCVLDHQYYYMINDYYILSF